MFWSLRENLCGLNHMGRLAARIALGRSRLYYVEKLKKSGFAVEAVLDDRGETLNCRLCGFANLRFALSPGFEMTACSSLARSVLLHQDRLNLWSSALPKNSREAMAGVKIGDNAEAQSHIPVVKGSAGSKI
ncbi:MAG: hypothetical protein JST01_05420 [Cyanobacteria bacterium SZAS TMP-1]|nr:hypothetical protein [Cyanobacteria bacterium SZAS TMP-1]